MGWFLEEMDAGTSTGRNSARRGEMKNTEHPEQRRGRPTDPTETSEASSVTEGKLHQLTCKLEKADKSSENNPLKLNQKTLKHRESYIFQIN